MPSSDFAPTFSPMYSIGASSRSPSPMTMVPRIGTVSMVRRMASTATWSACFRSPCPMVCAEAIAASSTTRTNSSASSNSRCCANCSSADWVWFLLAVAMEIPSAKVGCVLLVRVDPGDVRANDQCMDIVRALVRLHRFQVHHVPHDRVIVHNAIRAQHIARQAGALQCHPHVVTLRHRDVLLLHFAGILQSPDLQGEKLCFGDLRDHPNKLFLDQLTRGDRGIVELLALL